MSSFFGATRDDDQSHQLQMIQQQQQQQQLQLQPQQQQHQQNSSSLPASSAVTQKKKRNLPGTPNPDAEVIALSPKSLMATNRFICEVCNKGFQREQNLQLHRRGHNLPWKLKQKSNKEVKRKVYLCPEPTCVHHDPSRALGDLTGIKKHYSRKHGEKKWKCEKCSKKYAVQSDWKAHSKTCGTREYRCDCGTLFSRRDSFITHRAFCDALAQESARHPTGLGSIGSQLYGSSTNRPSLGLDFQVGSQMPSNNMLRLGNAVKFDHHGLTMPPASNPNNPFGQHQQMPSPSSMFMNDPNMNQGGFQEQSNQQGLMIPNKALFHGMMNLSDHHDQSPNSASGNNNMFNLGFYPNGTSNRSMNNNPSNSSTNNLSSSSGFLSSDDQFNIGISANNVGGGGGQPSSTNLFPSNMNSMYGNPSLQLENLSPHMSATALLQKAAQIGSTSSGNNSSTLLRGLAGSSNPTAKSDNRAPVPPQLLSPGNIAGSTNSSSTTTFGPSGTTTLKPTLMDNDTHFQGLINSFTNGNSSIFSEQNGFTGFGDSTDHHRPQLNINNTSFGSSSDVNKQLQQTLGRGSDKLTLDFLGVGGIVRNNMNAAAAAAAASGFSQRREQQQQNQQGGDVRSSLESAAAQANPPFGNAKFQ
ncbi:unnamed protein product [Rhodiola kirilowii]